MPDIRETPTGKEDPDKKLLLDKLKAFTYYPARLVSGEKETYAVELQGEKTNEKMRLYGPPLVLNATEKNIPPELRTRLNKKRPLRPSDMSIVEVIFKFGTPETEIYQIVLDRDELQVYEQTYRKGKTISPSFIGKEMPGINMDTAHSMEDIPVGSMDTRGYFWTLANDEMKRNVVGRIMALETQRSLSNSVSLHVGSPVHWDGTSSTI